jgi:hypothetical protein
LKGRKEMSYDENMDCVFYDIDCGCTLRKLRPNGKLACIRLEDEKADWKLFHERVSRWQEHYMGQLTMDELEGFSEDLIDAVKLILSR